MTYQTKKQAVANLSSVKFDLEKYNATFPELRPITSSRELEQEADFQEELKTSIGNLAEQGDKLAERYLDSYNYGLSDDWLDSSNLGFQEVPNIVSKPDSEL